MHELQTKSALITKLNDNIAKLEQNDRGSQDRIQVLQIEKAELLVIKSEHTTLLKKHAKLEQHLQEEQRSFRKNMDLKAKELHENQDISNKGIKSLEEKLSSSHDKNK